MSQVSRVNILSDAAVNLPTVLAAVTSVGLHALVWAYQPALPMSDKLAANDRRNVKVVRLTPDEMLRLPQYAQAQPSLPMPQLSIPPTNVLPNLPKAESNISLPPPPSSPIYNPNPPVSQFSSGLGAESSRRSQNTIPASPNQLPKPRATKGKTQVQETQQSSPSTIGQFSRVLESHQKAESTTNQLSQVQEKLQQTGKAASTQTQQSSEEASRQSKRSPQRQTSEEANRQSKRSQPSPQTTGSIDGELMRVFEESRTQQNLGTPTPPTRQTQNTPRSNGRKEQTAGRLTQGMQPGLIPPATDSQVASDTQTENSDTGNSLAQLQAHGMNSDSDRSSSNGQLVGEARIKARYGYDVTGTTVREGIANYQLWLDKRIDRYSKLNQRRPVPDSVRSPFEVKLPDVTPASVVVLVGPDGKIVGEPELVRRTGYSKLDRLVLDNIKKRSFPESGKYEVYQYLFEIDEKGLPSANGASSNG